MVLIMIFYPLAWKATNGKSLGQMAKIENKERCNQSNGSSWK